jgi:hypothetical protein
MLQNLLIKWNEYISVVKMSNTEFQVIIDSEHAQQNLEEMQDENKETQEVNWSKEFERSSE